MPRPGSQIPTQPPSLSGTVRRVCMAQHMPGCCAMFVAPCDQHLEIIFQKLKVAWSWVMACHISDSKHNAQTYIPIWRCQRFQSTRLGTLRPDQKPGQKPEGGAEWAAILGEAVAPLALPSTNHCSLGAKWNKTPGERKQFPFTWWHIWILNCSDTTGFWRGEAKNTGQNT